MDNKKSIVAIALQCVQAVVLVVVLVVVGSLSTKLSGVVDVAKLLQAGQNELASQVNDLGASTAKLGTAVNTGVESVFTCVGLKDDDTSRTLVQCHSSVPLPGTGNVRPISNILTNNLGGPDIIVDSAEITGIGKVSSTLSIGIFATSTPATSTTIPYNIAINPASLGVTSTLLYKQLATSTSMQLIGTLNEIQNQDASSTVIVPSASGLHIILMNPYLDGCIPSSQKCESVTSTNRGFTNGQVDVKFHYYKDF